MEKVLFICVHNSARSQMAEAYLNAFGGGEFVAESAGFEPTEINPLVVEAMKEEGIDLSGHRTQSAFDLYKEGRMFSYVVTVCEESVEKQCPVYPGMTHRLHLPFPDPAEVQGTHEEKLAQVRVIRDRIKAVVYEFLEWARSGDIKKLSDFWEIRPLD
ncbi:arsenate reductase ArsC [Pseudodesulfovibrio karagichevae]|uniref:Arsenate reductase ArsC n=1 Tax=Pseudodesulfovibrio karagichevae TaxID=3239305 RepID=A0ABV4JYI7_9BACT